MKIEDIKLYPKNAKKHNRKQIRLIAGSLRRFGWQQPIKIGKDNFILAGHGRLLAYKAYPNDIKEPWVIDEIGKTVIGAPEERKLTPEEEVAYRLADNEIAKAATDMDIVAEEYASLEESLREITGYDDELLTAKDTLNDLADSAYPIVPKFSEKYTAYIIVVENEIDAQFVETTLDIDKAKSYKSDKISRTYVIGVDQLKKAWKLK